MPKMVGLVKPLKPEWMDRAAELFIEGQQIGQIKQSINEYLSYEIKSAIVVSKTRESLVNLWGNATHRTDRIRDLAIETYMNEPKSRNAVHWSLMLLTYPVFADIAGYIGRISSMQDTFTKSWVREKLYGSWGERNELIQSVTHIVRTMIEFGALERVKMGTYRTKSKMLSGDLAKRLLVETSKALSAQAYYELSELTNVPQMFPFDYTVTHEWIYNTGYFEMTGVAGRPVMVN